MEYLFIYLLQVADTIEMVTFLGCTIATILGICGIVFAFFRMSEGEFGEPDEYDKEHKTTGYCFYIIKNGCFKTALITFLCTSIISLIPTKQTLLLMGGTYLGKKAVNTVVTDEKIKKIDTIINLQLDKYIKDLKKEG